MSEREPRPLYSQRTRGTMRRRLGPIFIWAPGNGSGYRARCTATDCMWRDGDRKSGDYIWRVQERALAHIAERHERRKGGDRRTKVP